MLLTKEVLYQIENAWSEGSATSCSRAMMTLSKYAESVMNGEPLVIETPTGKILVKDTADFLLWKHHAPYVTCQFTNVGVGIQFIGNLLEKAVKNPLFPLIEIHQLRPETSAHLSVTFVRKTESFTIILQGAEHTESDWFNRKLEITDINIRTMQWETGHIRDDHQFHDRLELKLTFPDLTTLTLCAAYVYI